MRPTSPNRAWWRTGLGGAELKGIRRCLGLVKAIVPAFLALVTLSCATGERPVAHKLSYRHPTGGGVNDYSMMLDGVTYAHRDTFLAAVANLPPRSRLNWYSGCICFEEIPLGPSPRMSIPAFKAFCRSHRIRFEYQCGFRPEPLVTKSFPVSRSLVAAHPDARTWLEAQGVPFPPKASARWDFAKQRLVVCHDAQNLDLVAYLLEYAETQ